MPPNIPTVQTARSPFEDERDRSAWPRLLTVEDAAHYLSMDARTVRRLLVRGEFRVLRAGVRRTLIDRLDLDRWVSGHVGPWDPDAD